MDKSICIFGDSITWGSSDWEGGGWANRLQYYMNGLDEPRWQRVFVLGIPGNTTGDLLKRFKTEAEARDPGTIIIGIGINDTYSKEPDGLPIISSEEFKKNIHKLAEIAKSQAENIVFIGLMHVDESKTMPRPTRQVYCSNKTVDDCNAIIKETCDTNGLYFIPVSDTLVWSDLDDGLHPNGAGHEKIFEQVKDFLTDKKLI